MTRVTASITEDEERIIEEKVGDGSDYASKSEFVRECIQQYERVEDLQERVDDLEEQLSAVRQERDQLREEADRVDGLETELEQAEARIDELTEQLRMANAKDERVDELAKYAERQRTTEQRWRQASILMRMKWRVTGMPAEG